ncbi:alkaline phosphatase PhoX [Oceaniserpentilla sp. 4NH20-0058]|uniref:alkaline phosphatase PhoX n=1 Tax=Oceaniserpentilla sp. 4NH20-0058 TaxID=3127660 RepID=UPI00333E9365
MGNIKKPLASAIMLATLGMLTACGSDGDEGISGRNGVDGTNGLNGTDGIDGLNGTDGSNGSNGADAGLMTAGLTRLATVPAGAEVTGAFLTQQGDLFFNVQHPSDANLETDKDDKVFNKGTVGVLKGVNINNLPKNLISSPVPQSTKERQTVVSAYGEYQVIAQTGDTFSGGLPNGLGVVYDKNGTAEVVTIDDPDFNGFVETAENEGYLFTNWESIPGGMSRLKVNKTNAGWVVDNSDVMMLDFGDWGTIANCFGSVSPWGTPLTSEEWGNFGDSTHLWDDLSADDSYGNRDALKAYMDPTNSSPNVVPNTYRLHYIVEIEDAISANPTPVKRYAMGRFEHENSIVMPDRKTVYLSQDNTNGVMFKFVADVAEDLSAGTLYGAKLTQDTGSTEPQTTGFDITWIELAHGSDAEIETWIAQYDAIEYHDGGDTSYLTDADAQAWADGAANYPTVANGGGKVTAEQAMDNRIAFLESRKAARAKGATAEWRKFEGIYVNQKRAEEAVEGTDLVSGEDVDQAFVYFAIADMDKGMIDDEGDIQLSARVKDCGGVYRMPLLAGYDVARIEPVVMGSTYRSSLTGAERCDVNALSQPDNVIVMDDGRIIIGEDGFQENNTLWIYNPKVND